MGFIEHHEADAEFPWKAIYAFPQSIRWLNVNDAWGKLQVGWFVFERGYGGEVIREKIRFRRNKLAHAQQPPVPIESRRGTNGTSLPCRG
jgi:hypothetical protein